MLCSVFDRYAIDVEQLVNPFVLKLLSGLGDLCFWMALFLPLIIFLEPRLGVEFAKTLKAVGEPRLLVFIAAGVLDPAPYLLFMKLKLRESSS